MNKHTLHIVSFTVPFPANYGGVIDVFYKIKALHSLGVDLILHCFKSKRSEAIELEKYCSKVHYYQRSNNPFLLLGNTPFIVASRQSDTLERILLQDNFPVLLEGLHCCALLKNQKFIGRKIIVRSHNIEHEYYRHLALSEKRFLKKLYFVTEAKKLLKFEQKVFPMASEILGISEKDTNYIKHKYKKGTWVSAFHQFDCVEISTQTENYAYYHGNLEIAENNQAALFLVNEVFKHSDYRLIIAGNNPSQELITACEKLKNVELMSGISSEKIIKLLGKAQINILPTFQSTGIKLKLLAALFNGNHCLVNSPMVEGTGLENLCHIADTPSELLQNIKELQNKTLSENEIQQRNEKLIPFSNSKNAEKILKLLNNKTF